MLEIIASASPEEALEIFVAGLRGLERLVVVAGSIYLISIGGAALGQELKRRGRTLKEANVQLNVSSKDAIQSLTANLSDIAQGSVILLMGMILLGISSCNQIRIKDVIVAGPLSPTSDEPVAFAANGTRPNGGRSREILMGNSVSAISLFVSDLQKQKTLFPDTIGEVTYWQKYREFLAYLDPVLEDLANAPSRQKEQQDESNERMRYANFLAYVRKIQTGQFASYNEDNFSLILRNGQRLSADPVNWKWEG